MLKNIKKSNRFTAEIKWSGTMLNPQNMAFPHPLLNSRASPYPKRTQRKNHSGLRAWAPSELCSAGWHCIATLPHPPTRSSAALYFFWSGTSQSLSSIMSWITAPWTPTSHKSNWPWSTQGFPLRSDHSQWLPTDFLKKGARGLQEHVKSNPINKSPCSPS